MKHSIILTSFVAVAITLASCGASKKLKAANETISTLQATNADLTKKVADQQKELDDYAKTREVALQEFSKYRAECEDAKAKLAVVREAFIEQYNNLQALDAKLEEAMANFKDNGVDIYYKDGLVFVSMQDNLLYKPGSSDLGDGGKKALGSLANVLNDYPDLKVIVVGNTDDAQFKKNASMDNWKLSTDRANGVVRTLRDDYKVNPVRLTSAGKGKYNPVADNATTDGRAKNRRTDIILNPNLEKIWQSVQTH